jgi:hypothetical protein
VKFADNMKKLNTDYIATSYPAWLKEHGMFDCAKSRSTYAALGTIVQQFSSLDKATVEMLFADSEVPAPVEKKTIQQDIKDLIQSLLEFKESNPILARHAQICITKLEDIFYRCAVEMIE